MIRKSLLNEGGGQPGSQPDPDFFAENPCGITTAPPAASSEQAGAPWGSRGFTGRRDQGVDTRRAKVAGRYPVGPPRFLIRPLLRCPGILLLTHPAASAPAARPRLFSVASSSGLRRTPTSVPRSPPAAAVGTTATRCMRPSAPQPGRRSHGRWRPRKTPRSRWWRSCWTRPPSAGFAAAIAVLDRGYDPESVYAGIEKRGIRPVISLRVTLAVKRGLASPPRGATSAGTGSKDCTRITRRTIHGTARRDGASESPAHPRRPG